VKRSLLSALSVALIWGPSLAWATTASRVFLNGVPTPVYFNDGDSFRVLEGPLSGSKARLEGFNTLETFGPAHQWGDWHAFELYVFSKMATLNARQGTWHCTSDLSTDTYGRTLWVCPDLAVDQIRKGLAHAMNVNQEPSRIEYLRAQREAIAERRGFWFHGVPDFIVTSLHSRSEDPSKPVHYNRLVSTLDGHSEPWTHNDTYDVCSTVCARVKRIDFEKVKALAQALREDAALAPSLSPWNNLYLELLVSMYGRRELFPDWVPNELKEPLKAFFEKARARGDFGEMSEQQASCALYVPFEQRYRKPVPSCLEHP
jgi:endonuclease YncB( thermonuclease family)